MTSNQHFMYIFTKNEKENIVKIILKGSILKFSVWDATHA